MGDSHLANRLGDARTAQQVGGELAQRGQAPKTVVGWVTSDTTRNEIARYLQNDKDMADRLLRVAQTQIRAIPDLGQCSMESFAGALMQCAACKLEPGRPLDLAWILPFKNHGVMEATFVIGYPGVVQLALRSALVGDISAESVCEGDDFDFDAGLNWVTHKRPRRGRRGPAYAYYSVVRYVNAGRHIEFMTKEEVEDHAERYSRSYKSKSASSPWRTNFDEMAEKTCVLKGRRYMPASPDFVQALTGDERTMIWSPGSGLRPEDVVEALPAAVNGEATREANGTEDSARLNTDEAPE